MSTNQKDLVIGVDLGATSVKAGLVQEGKILREVSNSLPVDLNNAYTVIDVLTKTIEQVLVPNVKGIGVGIPSLVDREKGIVYYVQNIPSWKTVYLKKILQEKFNLPVQLDNDCNCFAIGERLYGQGRSIENFVAMTIGGGLGAGIINRGKLLSDINCGSGEFGSIPYLDGIYEDYCCGKFFKTHYKVPGEKLAEKAMRKDPEAVKAFDEFGKHLGNMIKTIMFTIDPEAIIVGGSVAKSSRLFETSMKQEIKTFPYFQSAIKIRILYSTLMNTGVLGAAAMFFDSQR